MLATGSDNARQWPGYASPLPRKRSRGTAGSSPSGASAVNGTVRASRTPRVFALLTRIEMIHVLIEERPSKRSSPWITASQVSCTTSSATARPFT